MSLQTEEGGRAVEELELRTHIPLIGRNAARAVHRELWMGAATKQVGILEDQATGDTGPVETVRSKAALAKGRSDKGRRENRSGRLQVDVCERVGRMVELAEARDLGLRGERFSDVAARRRESGKRPVVMG